MAAAPRLAERRAVIVGAGPAGVLAAVSLANRGWRCSVLEARSAVDVTTSRSYSMIISRGVRTLTEAGLQLPALDPAGNTFKRVMRAVPAGVFSSRLGGPGSKYVVDRGELAGQLVQQAAALHPEAITFRWDCALKAVDWGRQVAVASSGQEGQRVLLELPYDLLVGADGANSRTRELMQEAGHLSWRPLYNTLSGYKTYRNVRVASASVAAPAAAAAGRAAIHRAEAAAGAQPQAPVQQPAQEAAGTLEACLAAQAPRESLCWWNGRGKRGQPVMVGMWQHAPGQWGGTVRGISSWDGAEAELAAALPLLPPGFASQIAAQVSEAAQPLNQGGRAITVSSYVAPQAVLLGDSAHAVTANLGQGCNCALESVAVFMGALDAAGGDVPAALKAFNRQRRRDTYALQRLDIMFLLHRGAPVSTIPWMWKLDARVTVPAAMVAQALWPRALLWLTMGGRRHPIEAAAASVPAASRAPPPQEPLLDQQGRPVRDEPAQQVFDAMSDPAIPYGVVLRGLRLQAAGMYMGGTALAAAGAYGLARLAAAVLR